METGALNDCLPRWPGKVRAGACVFPTTIRESSDI